MEKEQAGTLVEITDKLNQSQKCLFCSDKTQSCNRLIQTPDIVGGLSLNVLLMLSS